MESDGRRDRGLLAGAGVMQPAPPFVLNLSKHCFFSLYAGLSEERPFDKLRANGLEGFIR